jgi:hypothetical protein
VKLKSTNPDFDPDEILACFDASDRGTGAVDDTEDSTAVFEHGQWWVTCPSGAQFSVVDATGPGTVGGFDFEQVSEGER